MAIKINGVTVAGMSSKVRIDKTLSIEGAAADAKAVSEAIAASPTPGEYFEITGEIYA